MGLNTGIFQPTYHIFNQISFLSLNVFFKDLKKAKLATAITINPATAKKISFVPTIFDIC